MHPLFVPRRRRTGLGLPLLGGTPMLAVARCCCRRPCLCARAHAAVRGRDAGARWRVEMQVAWSAHRPSGQASVALEHWRPPALAAGACWRLAAAAGNRRVRTRVRDPRHYCRVELGACACAAAVRQRHPWGMCLGRMCAPQSLPCKMAGRQWIRCAPGSTQPPWRSAP